MKPRDIGWVLWLTCLGSCAIQRSSLDRAATLDPAGGDAVVVLAVEPRSQVLLYEGETDGWTWRQTNTRAVANLWTEDNFLVLRLPRRIGNQSYAIGLAMPYGFDGPKFTAYQGNGVPVFHAPAGQVTFVGGVSLRPRGEFLSAEIDETATIERAHRFMQQSYPRLPVAASETLELVPAHDRIEIDRSDRILSSFALGFYLGPSRLKGPAAQRAVAGPGEATLFTLALSLWDELALGLTAGRVVPRDRKPFSEVVVECTTYYGFTEGCGDPHSAESDIVATTLSVETGYQRRFRPWRPVALLPAVLVGYTWNPGGLSREIVACDDCKKVPIGGVSARGAYVAPTFKVTFLSGFLALGVRSEIFLTGDVAHRTMLGLELGAP
jgi:hypothetical protein